MEDEQPSDDALAAPMGDAPFRPWGASGVPQPGADRPQRSVPPVPPAVPYDHGSLLPGVPAPEARPPKFVPTPQPGPTASPYPQYPQYAQPVRVEHVHINANRGPSGAGLASFILGILSFVIPWLGSRRSRRSCSA